MKKLFFSLLAVAIAVGGSAFTTSMVPSGTIYGSTTTNYTQRSTTSFSPTDCTNTAAKTCAYVVTEAGEDFVTESSYTNEEILELLSQGYLAPAPSSNSGIYTAP